MYCVHDILYEKINLNKIFLQVEAQGGVVLGAAYSFQSSSRAIGIPKSSQAVPVTFEPLWAVRSEMDGYDRSLQHLYYSVL